MCTRYYCNMYLAWGGDTLDAGGGITLMRDARSRSGAELLAEEEGRSLRRLCDLYSRGAAFRP